MPNQSPFSSKASAPRRTTASTSTALNHSPFLASDGQGLLKSMRGIDEQTQLSLRDAEGAHNKLSSWKATAGELLSTKHPGTMIWYRDHINDLKEMASHVKYFYGGTAARLAELIQTGVINNGMMQDKQHTKMFMDLEMKQLEKNLAELEIKLKQVEEMWNKKFEMWLVSEG